jgi:predicted DNA-binding transcriptional regulator AlpA
VPSLEVLGSSMESKFLTTSETANYLRTTQGSLANLRYQGEGPPYFRLGRRILYDKLEVIKWLEKHKVLTKDSLQITTK